jgi:hypothetical protein
MRRVTLRAWVLSLCLVLGLPLAPDAWAQAADSALPAKPKREKVIDFEDELVEGMNKRPLDSLSQIGEAARRKKKPHLYRKRAGFRAETQQTLREARFLP